jgi:hypothetical protein
MVVPTHSAHMYPCMWCCTNNVQCLTHACVSVMQTHDAHMCPCMCQCCAHSRCTNDWYRSEAKGEVPLTLVLSRPLLPVLRLQPTRPARPQDQAVHLSRAGDSIHQIRIVFGQQHARDSNVSINEPMEPRLRLEGEAPPSLSELPAVQIQSGLVPPEPTATQGAINVATPSPVAVTQPMLFAALQGASPLRQSTRVSKPGVLRNSLSPPPPTECCSSAAR